MPLHCCSESCTQGMLRFYCHKITWKIRFLAPSHAKDSNYTGRGHAGTVGSSGSIQGEGISSALLHVPTLTWCDTSHPGSLLHKQHAGCSRSGMPCRDGARLLAAALWWPCTRHSHAQRISLGYSQKHISGPKTRIAFPHPPLFRSLL